MTEQEGQNPWGALGAWLKQAAAAVRKRKLDELFLLVDRDKSPMTASIRGLGDESDDLVRGIIMTLAELERRLPAGK